MDTHLSASDMAAAVVHRTKVEARLGQILDEIWGTCTVEGTKQNQWKYEYRELWYRSPRIGAKDDLYLQFGFDFVSKYEHWNVRSLALPSAYFALRGVSDYSEKELPALPDAWSDPPSSWGWTGKAKVKRMDVVVIKGDSLRSAYRDFFIAGLKEAEEAIEQLQ